MGSDESGGSDDEEVLAALERAMVRFRRSVARRTLGRRMARDLGGSLDLNHVAVVDAVEDGEDRGAEVTVGDVAGAAAVDPSRASRMVSAAIADGLVVRGVSQQDGRRSVLHLTEAGRALAGQVRAYRRAAFGEAIRDWSPQDRREFTRLFGRFVGDWGERSGED